MTDRELERKLADAVTCAAPDDLDAILSRCGAQNGSVMELKELRSNENTKIAQVKPRKTLRPWLAAACAALVLLLATLMGQTMNNYLFLDYFKNAKALSAVNVVSVGGTLLLAPFISVIVAKFGKKEAGAVGMLAAGVVYLLLFFLRVKSIPLFMALLFLGTLGTGLFNMIIWAFITDIIDYQEIAAGRREDGTVYAVYSFARKVGPAIAGGLGGFVLTAIGYISEAASQTEVVAERIYTVATLVPGVCYLAVFLIIRFAYPLGRKDVEQNTAILRERRESENGKGV